MVHYDSRDGTKNGPLDTSPDMTERLYTISDFLPAEQEHNRAVINDTRVSMISLPTPVSPSAIRDWESEAADISHVRLSVGGRGSPLDEAGSRGPSPAAAIPDALQPAGMSSPRSFNPFSKINTAYAPVPTASSEGTSLSKKVSVKRKSSALAKFRHRSIQVEEMNMHLLGSVADMGQSKESPDGIPEGVENEHTPMMPSAGDGPVDRSLVAEPMSPQTETQLQELNRQEAAGILTGGLGIGLKPKTSIKSSDLYKGLPPSPSPLSPAMGRRMSFRKPELNRSETLRSLGQSEANKRGEIIEVIMEEELIATAVDISSFAGGSATKINREFNKMEVPAVNPNPKRRSFFQPSNVEVFYPRANWKPFSMRWPYLSALISISVVLAAAQEYLYHKSTQKPLYQFISPASLNTWDYFSFKYLPTFVAVTYGILWQITDFEVKRLEPYYQLSREGGALAAESITVDYITFFNFFRPIKALRYKHYAIAVSSIATLMAVSLVPILQSASVVLTPDRAERDKHPQDLKEIHINSGFSRTLSVVLILIAVFGCVLVWQLQRRPSGLVADVKGVAGIAAMANRSHILMDFKDMDTATPEMIHQKLKDHRYLLRNSSLAPEENVPLTQEDKDKYDQERRHDNPHPLMLRLVAGIPFVIGMMVFMLLVPVILFTSANILTDKAPWFLTFLAVCIKIQWGSLETAVRMIEPFYILSRRHAPPKVLTLDYTAMAFGWLPIRAFLNGHFLVFFVGLGSVFAEILTVCATSFSGVTGNDFTIHHSRRDGSDVDTGEETYASFWVSFAFSIIILTYLCSVAGVVYWRRRHSFLPRQPNSIASILAFIHQSKMLYDFVGTEKMNNDEMVTRLVGFKKSYGLGWFTGRDGEMHCGVDEEELLGDYKHGSDAKAASMPWTTNWSDY
ncbi:hypothetical protein B7494_g6974 [Chlorociboria aeruginascens]|nr:hypothetical protein B7494_g6974 [Chlorociboria aeruginascens]